MTMPLPLADRALLPRGRIRYEVRSKGVVIERVDDANLVVSQATTIMAHALGGAAATGVLTQFGVGSNLLAPSAGNTVLTSPYYNSLFNPTYGVGQVTFSFALASGEANGLSIGEVGLLTASGLLFARKVRQALLPKTADISLSGTWNIYW